MSNKLEVSLGRRRFLQMTAASGLVGLYRPTVVIGSTNGYRVGVGKSTDPYKATMRAIQASGEWSKVDITNKTVLVKPNLVSAYPASTGVTTDPEVVRAIADLALGDGAKRVCIIEGGFGGANFSSCGYDDLSMYHPQVELIDLNNTSLSYKNVSTSLAYQWMYVPKLLLDDGVVFISAGKMKTHFCTYTSLSCKNLIGCGPLEKYSHSSEYLLFDYHYRGIDQVIVDWIAVRPVDFAVVDGVWALEGNGPTYGNPIRLETVIAGRNPVAVDRVCLNTMDIPQRVVQHLQYAARMGLGPYDTSNIEITGDPLETIPFRYPDDLPPILEYPKVIPRTFRSGSANDMLILFGSGADCQTRLDVFRISDFSPQIDHVKTLADWNDVNAGIGFHSWNGQNEFHRPVPPGSYAVMLQAKYKGSDNKAYATGLFRIV